MSVVSRILNLLRYLSSKDKAENELSEEVGSYLELLVERRIQNGMDPKEARRISMIELGGIEQTKEKVREARLGRYFEIILQDVRYSIRMLIKSPASTAVAILSLALGIGANAAVFSVVNSLLLHPYPFPDLDRIMLVRENRVGDDVGQGRVAVADYLDLQRDNQAFDQIGAWSLREFNSTGAGEPEHIYCALVTANFFEMLGIRPSVGHAFTVDDEQQGHDRIVVVSHIFWQQRLAADPSLVGKTLQLNGQSTQLQE